AGIRPALPLCHFGATGTTQTRRWKAQGFRGAGRVAVASRTAIQEGPKKPTLVQTLIEDFLQHLRHERGHAEHTQKTYAALLKKFVAWAKTQGLAAWSSVELSHLMAFLQHERERGLANQPKGSPQRLSSESLYLEIAALRAFY